MAGGFSVPLGLVAQEGSELTLCHSAACTYGVLHRGDIWLTPQVKNLVLKWFLPRLFLLRRLGRRPGGRVLVTSAQGGWPVPSSFLLQGQAGPQERCGVGGEHPAAPSLTRWAVLPWRVPPAASLWPKGLRNETSPLPPPHLVLRLPAEMQLKQLIF